MLLFKPRACYNRGMNKEVEKKFELKIKVLTHYGNGKCTCVICGFDDLRALSIDHIDGGGGEHRRKMGYSTIYRWLVVNDYPEGYQTLCMNCQFIKRYKKEIPFLKLRKAKTLSKRIEAWVEQRNGQFNLWALRVGLNLAPSEAQDLRVYLHKMKKRGLLVGYGNGVFKRCVKPVSVFGVKGDRAYKAS